MGSDFSMGAARQWAALILLYIVCGGCFLPTYKRLSPAAYKSYEALNNKNASDFSLLGSAASEGHRA